MYFVFVMGKRSDTDHYTITDYRARYCAEQPTRFTSYEAALEKARSMATTYPTHRFAVLGALAIVENTPQITVHKGLMR